MRTLSISAYKNLLKKKNKYNARKIHYGDSRYDSIYESEIAQELDWRLKAGDITKYERQVKLPLVVNSVKVCNYIIDFIAYLPDGSREFIEAKGYSTTAWKIKYRLFESLFEKEFKKHPNDKIIIRRKQHVGT